MMGSGGPEEQGRAVPDLAYDGGDAAVACLADEPDRYVTEGGHDAGPRAGPDPGVVLTVGDIPYLLQGSFGCCMTLLL